MNDFELSILNEINQIRGTNKGISYSKIEDAVEKQPGEYVTLTDYFQKHGGSNCCRIKVSHLLHKAGFRKRTTRSKYWEAPNASP